MAEGYPRRRWLSQSAHWKEARKSYPGAGEMSDLPMQERDGKPTHVNSKPSTCVQCNADVAIGDGWLLLLPKGAGQRGSPFAVMCQTCSSPKPSHP